MPPVLRVALARSALTRVALPRAGTRALHSTRKLTNQEDTTTQEPTTEDATTQSPITTSTSQSPDWNAPAYLRFNEERSRPARELLARLPPDFNPSRIVDLGCGPANSTALLHERFPSATSLRGIDSSPGMLEAARAALPAARFEQADLKDYLVPQKTDLVFSNAALHWLPSDILIITLRRFISRLAPGAVFAMQVPDNVWETPHWLMVKTATMKDAPWTETLAAAGRQQMRKEFPRPVQLFRALGPITVGLDVWRTEYYHKLPGHEAVVDWFRESALRPFLEPLDEVQRKAFEEAYLKKLQLQLPKMRDGSVYLKFPRLFLVCARGKQSPKKQTQE